MIDQIQYLTRVAVLSPTTYQLRTADPNHVLKADTNRYIAVQHRVSESAGFVKHSLCSGSFGGGPHQLG